MKNTRTRSLIVLNLFLMVLVGSLAIVRHAGANGQPTRARGSYTMVSGSIQGGSNDVVYIIDSSNQELLSLGWDNSKGNLYVIGHRSLVTDSRNQRGNR